MLHNGRIPDTPGSSWLAPGVAWATVTIVDESLRLRPYVARLAVEWLATAPQLSTRRLPGTLAFVDVSGFTALTERLAAQGKAGAEEIGEVLDSTFAQLLDIGYEYGAGLVKFGGDATLLFFAGEGHAVRACRASALMVRAMKDVGRLKTSVGPVTLRVSVGVHSGDVDFMLLGDRHRELVVTGPAATATATMEALAQAGEIVVSAATAGCLAAKHVGDHRDGGYVLRGVPLAVSAPARTPPDVSAVDVGSLLCATVREHLHVGGDDSAHRFAAAGFIDVHGVDELMAAEGPDAAAAALDRVVRRAMAAGEERGATFLGTDISPDGTKVIFLGGVPRALGNDEERVLQAVRDVVSVDEGPLTLRGGVNCGRMYVGEFGPAYRRAWSVMGDAVNLAARLMAKAQAGQVLATEPVLDASRSRFRTQPLEPFLVKGKAEPVVAFSVFEPMTVEDVTMTDGPLIGRDHELTTLLDAAQRALDTAGSVVEVTGEPGMGKTRLLQEARSRWQLPTLALGCQDYDATRPYVALRQLVLQALAVPGDPTSLDAMLRALVLGPLRAQAQWLPLLQELVGLPADDTDAVRSLEPKFRPARLEEAVLALLRHQLGRPTAIVVEDVHAMDESSAAVLQSIAEAASDRRWLLVLARRPREAGLRVSGRSVGRLELRPLAESSLLALLDLDERALSLPPHEQRALIERAGGNPLFLRTLLRARFSAADLAELPDSLEALLAAEIDRLSPADRRVLRTAAVLGVYVDESVLRAMLPRNTTLTRATWNRLAEYIALDRPGVLRFTHALVRDAAYEGLSFRTRRALHAHAGAMLSEQCDDDEHASVLATHFFEAQIYDRALHYARRAGDRALALYSSSEAAELFEQALAAARKTSAAGQQVTDLLVSLGHARMALAQFDIAGTCYAKAAGRPGQAPVSLAEIRLLQAHAAWLMGDYPAALRSLKRVRDAVSGMDAPEAMAVRARALAQQAWILMITGKLSRADAVARLAVDLAERSGDEAAIAGAYGYLDAIELQQGRLGVPEADTYGARALAILERIGNVRAQGHLLQRLAYRAYYEGRWDDCVRYRERGLDCFRKVGDEWMAAVEMTNVAEMYIDRGVVAEADALLHQARRALLASEGAREVIFFLLCQARLLMLQRRWDEALELLDDARRRADEADANAVKAEIDTRTAECLAGAGELTDAQLLAEGMLGGTTDIGALRPVLFRVLASAAGQLGDMTAAGAFLEAGLSAAQDAGLLHEEAFTLAARSTVLGADLPPEERQRKEALFSRLGISWPLQLPLSAPEVPEQVRPADVAAG